MGNTSKIENEKIIKKGFKENSGITLIALVITIIVLLILAGVTVATLTGDNGLLTKTSDAKKINEEATALEKIQVEVAGSYGLDEKIDIEQLNTNLKRINGLTYKGNEIDLNDLSKHISEFPATVKLNGYAFTISENGDVAKIQWIDNNDGSYTNAETGQTLTVGDRVKYETILNANAVDSTKLTQLKTDLQTYSGDSSSTDNANIARDNLTWKFLDIKDGKIRLISAVPTTSKIRLYNANGFNNAVYLLDKACDTLYSINGVGKSKNLKIEDIEEKLKSVNGKTARDNYTNTNVTPNLKYGDEKEYKSNLKYPNIYPSEVGCKALTTVDNNGNTLGLSEQTSPVTGSSTATNRLKVTQTYWYGTMSNTDFKDSKYYTIFMNNGSSLPTYWLSSRDVSCASNAATFNVRYVSDGNIGSFFMFFSNGDPSGPSCSFRPVITLNKEVTLSGNSTEGWTIQ